MTEHPRVLVEAARLATEELNGIGVGVSQRERERIVRELIEDQDQLAEIDALAQ